MKKLIYLLLINHNYKLYLIKTINAMDTIDLLTKTVDTPIQATTTDTKYPCTGFCYYAIQNKDKIYSLYFNGEKEKYYDLIERLIVDAGNRKRDNKNIPEEGEYIDQDTVKSDFDEIVKDMKFYEFGKVDDGEYNDLVINNVAIHLYDIKKYTPVIVNRSLETFLLIQVFEDQYIVVDSHKSKHGLVDTFGALNYITKYNNYQGTIQLGY